MKVAVIGAAGKAGKNIVNELIARDIAVTAIVRNAEQMAGRTVETIEKDLFELKREDLSGFDVVVNAFNAAPGQEDLHVDAGRALIEAVKGTETKLIVVGGAGSLYTNEDKTEMLMDSPEFPEDLYPRARNMAAALNELKESENVMWTYISPPASLDPNGIRTGSYETGEDYVLFNKAGKSYISYQDYAVALVDEIVNPKYENKRFTVVAEAE